MSCSICYERFASPVSLPCGHVFCRECLCRTVDANLKACGPQHSCPSCRAQYSVVSIDPALVPAYLRPHILPPIRPVYFDDAGTPALPVSGSQPQSQPAESPSSSLATSPPTSVGSPLPVSLRTPPSPTPSASSSSSQVDSHSQVESQSNSQIESPPPLGGSALGLAAAELSSLRLQLATWQRRAEQHAAANTQLLAFARATRGAAWRMRAERDAARNRAELLQMQVQEMSSRKRQRVEVNEAPIAAANLKRAMPVFLAQQQKHSDRSPQGRYPTAEPESEQTLLGPPLKRRRRTPPPTGWDEPSVFAASGSDAGIARVGGEVEMRA